MWGEVRSEWDTVLLGDVAEVRSGIAKNANKFLADPVDVAYLRVANVQDGYLDLSEIKTISIERSDVDRYRLLAGDVLMNEGGDIDKLGRGDVWEGQIEPCVHQNHVFSVRCGQTLLPRYLSFLAGSPYGKAYFLEKGKQTTNLASINKTQLREFPIPLPPLPEQRKISAILSTVDEVIQATQAVIEQTRRVKEGLLNELLSKGIGHSRLKQTEIGEIPEDWEILQLGMVAEVRSGIAKNSNKAFVDPVDVPFLRVANVQDGFIDLSEVKMIRIERENLKRFQLQPGDVLMNEGGDIDKLGRGDVWGGQINPCLHQNHVFAVRCGQSLMPRFLSYVAGSPYGKKYFFKCGKQSTNLASINKAQLRDFPIPFPTLSEQRGIVAVLSSVDDAINSELQISNQLQSLKSGLLQNLLTGKVRVTP